MLFLKKIALCWQEKIENFKYSVNSKKTHNSFENFTKFLELQNLKEILDWD
jgi:hypothetical protein